MTIPRELPQILDAACAALETFANVGPRCRHCGDPVHARRPDEPAVGDGWVHDRDGIAGCKGRITHAMPLALPAAEGWFKVASFSIGHDLEVGP